MTTTVLGRPVVLSLEAFAAITKLHPDHLRRLVALGVIDAVIAPGGQFSFRPDQLAILARVQRLRAGLGLDYTAAALVCQLLDRIDALERQVRMQGP